MKKTKINFHEPYISGNEKKYINDVFKIKNFFGIGKYTNLCEKILAKKLNQKNVLLTDSCTSSLEIAALLIKDNKKNEIILPSFTFPSTANAFLKSGFNLVFADSLKDDLMIDPNDISKKITPRTKAIVVVHLGGANADLINIQKICKKNNILLIEDAAQSYGSNYNSKNLGTFGDIGCFSFHETKNIHAGLAGAIFIKNKYLYKRALSIRDRGTNRHLLVKKKIKNYSWVEIGGSYYPTELQAAFLYSQLKNIAVNIKKRGVLFKCYEKYLGQLKQNKAFYFSEINKKLISNYHAFYIILNTSKSCFKLRKFLAKKNIYAHTWYMPLHQSLIGYKSTKKNMKLPILDKTHKNLLRLPLHNNLNVNDIKTVCKNINLFFKKNKFKSK